MSVDYEAAGIQTYKTCSDSTSPLHVYEYIPHHWDDDRLLRGCTRPPFVPHRFAQHARWYTQKRPHRSVYAWYEQSAQIFRHVHVWKGQAHARRAAGIRDRLAVVEGGMNH